MKSFRAPEPNGTGRKPTVLVADDNLLILEKASQVLAGSCDVVASVTDGRQALNASLLLDPDVVVLDVSMPELDGFEAARALRRAGSHAKIVMLTMHESNDLVVVAIKSGAQGYVLKTRMLWDLPSAINHALAGRTFVPSLSSLYAISRTGVGGHALHLRLDDSAFLDDLSGLLTASLRRGDMAVIVASEAMRAGVAHRLVANGCDLARAAHRGTYVTVDAMAEVAKVMAGEPYHISDCMAAIEHLERLRRAASASQVTIVGDLSALLWLAGKADAAIERERVWDDVSRGLPFLAVCSIPMGCFNEDEDPEGFRALCDLHAAICHARSA